MIRYQVEGKGQPTFAEMVNYLGQFPKLLDPHTSTAMKGAVAKAEAFIEPRIPVRTGAAKAVFFGEVLGFGKTLTGVVGFRGGKGAPYHINIVEHGARPHSLVKNSRQRTTAAFARFQKRAESGRLRGAHININGTWVTKTKHPGFASRGFMKAGFEHVKPILNHEMQKAVEDAFAQVKS